MTAARALPSPTEAPEQKPPRRPKKVADRIAERVAERIDSRDEDAAAANRTSDTATSTAEAAPRERSAGIATRPAAAGDGTRRGDWSAPGSAPFVTQVLAQEVLKQGLYIEPWKQAMNAYERAAETAGPRVRLQMP